MAWVWSEQKQDYVDDGAKAAPAGPIKSTAAAARGGVAPTPAVSTTEDVGRGILSGLGTGLVSLPGIAGDVEGLGRTGVNYFGKLFGAGGDTVDPTAALPNSEDWMKVGDYWFNKATGHSLNYDPQTGIGQAAKNISEFVPGAVVGGPGGFVKNAAKNAIRYGVVPGAVSEGAGQVTHEFAPSLEPAARMIGGIAGVPVGAGVSLAGGAIKRSLPEVAGGTRTAKSVAEEANRSYEAATKSGAAVKSGAMTRIASQVEQNAGKPIEHYNPDLNPQTHAALNHLYEAATSPRDMTIQQLDDTRKALRGAISTARKAGNDADAYKATQVLKQFDDGVSKLTANDVKGGTSALKTLDQARKTWAKSEKLDALEGVADGVKDKVAGGTSADVAIRNEFRTLKNGKDYELQFNETERNAIDDIIRGTVTQKTLRVLGKLSPGRMGAGIDSLLGLIGGGIHLGAGGELAGAGVRGAAVATAAAGTGLIARGALNRIKTGEMNNLTHQISRGRPAPARPRDVYPKIKAAGKRAVRTGNVFTRWGNQYSVDPATGSMTLVGPAEPGAPSTDPSTLPVGGGGSWVWDESKQDYVQK